MITYQDAIDEMDVLKHEYMNISFEIEATYLQPKELIKLPMKIKRLVDRENFLTDRIIEAFPQECIEKTALRAKREEVQIEYRRAQGIAMDIEKRLLGIKDSAKTQGLIKLN